MSLPYLDRPNAGWWVFGLLVLAGVTLVLQSFVGTFVFGVFIYYATRPIYRRVNRQVGPPSVAAVVSIVLLALPALLLAGYTLLVVVRELDRLTADSTFDPDQYPIIADLQTRIADPESLLSADLMQFVSADRVAQVLDSLGEAFDTVAFFGVAAVHLFLMFAIAFYLLRDDDRVADWARTEFATDGGSLVRFGRAVDHDLNSIFFGNILNAVVTGTIGFVVYTLLNLVAPAGIGIPAPALVGLTAGVASLIPVVGMKLVYVPVALYMGGRALLQGSTDLLWFVVAFAAASFVVVDTIPDLVLRPYVSGRSLHVGSVMVAYTLGPLLFGWYGIFLLPMLLVFGYQFGKIVLPRLLDGRTDGARTDRSAGPGDPGPGVGGPDTEGRSGSGRGSRAPVSGSDPPGGADERATGGVDPALLTGPVVISGRSRPVRGRRTNTAPDGGSSGRPEATEEPSPSDGGPSRPE
jgi:predicted PurR-regulated permease PerM